MTIQDFSSLIGAATAGSARKPLVLIVDDDEDNLLLLQYCLELFGCRCMSKTDGSNLVSLAQSVQPHLILLDIVMPKQSGTDLLHQLRANPQTRQIPVIAVTALARLEDRLRLLAEGFDDYLGKPFMLDDLQAAIDRHCCQPIAG